MKKTDRIEPDKYTDIEYFQFTQSDRTIMIQRAVGILMWPVILPLALVARVSDFLFLTCSELFSLVPFLLGTIVRYEFYKLTLTRCGKNVLIGFGTTFFYRDVEIGDHVHIGRYNTFHHCNLGSYVLIADGCRFLSGKYYHNFGRTDIPMALQGGKYRRIQLGSDSWIGTNAVVMDDIGEGSVVGAGAVVTSPIEEYAVAVGNPARVVKHRKAGPNQSKQNGVPLQR